MLPPLQLRKTNEQRPLKNKIDLPFPETEGGSFQKPLYRGSLNKKGVIRSVNGN